jgi:hypothetical protein
VGSGASRQAVLAPSDAVTMKEGGMRGRKVNFVVAVGVAAATLVLEAGSGPAWAGAPTTTPSVTTSKQPSAGTVCEPTAGERTKRIATAKLIIEYNSTDNDLGVHGAFDDDGWSELCVTDPNGRQILVTDPRGALKSLTMAGIFFESREPPASEFSMADLKTAFPAGMYRVRARSFDGTVLIGQATFTHDVPAAPQIRSPEIGEDPEQPGKAIPRNDVEIEWNPVTRSLDGKPIRITGYEVIITKVTDDDPNGFSRPTYDVHVLPSLSELSVPVEFLERGTVYELEVLALEQSGNQTISVGFFKTA